MKKLLAAAVVMLPLAAHAADGDFARQTAATQLVDFMNSIVPFDAALQDEQRFTLSKFSGGIPCSEQALPEVNKLLSSIYNYNTMRPRLIQNYATSFSFHELNDITAFYRSQSGRALLARQTQLQAGVRNAAAEMLKAKQVELSAIVSKNIGPDGKCKVPAEGAVQ